MRPMTNEYAISKHRFYELKHFCLQYPEWLKAYNNADGYSDEAGKNKGDTTSKDGMTRAQLFKNMQMVTNACKDTGMEYWPALFRYVISKSKKVPIDNSELFFYYYHKFFWLLSKRRG